MTQLKNLFLKCLNSNINFEDQDQDNKLRHNIINLTVALAIFGLFFGIANNILRDDHVGIIVDLSAIVILVLTIGSLRFKPEWFEAVTSILTVEFIIVFNLLIVISEPEDLRHIWLLTFPALIFFYKGAGAWLRWVVIFILSLFLTKLQPFYPINYTLGEIFYIAVVIATMTVVIYFYKARIDQANLTITRQKEELEALTKELESKVEEKTKELKQLNLNLEEKVEEKAKELVQKDALILAQSRQAAMGEMISMIAHQWRQPLSTITLQISNLKINSLLGKQSVDETNDALEHISSTIIYLSETIDDFQSFFKPNKQQEQKDICELVERGTNFAKPRLNVANIKLEYSCNKNINILTYPNEFAQVIINIINNAIDVLLERKIEQPKIKVTIIHVNHSVEIVINDNAGGIDMQNSSKIFEPYFSTKGKNGTGLGLYMSKMIIENELGGLLKVQNNEEGAEFVLSIPLSEDDEKNLS